MQEMQFQSLGQEDPLEKEMATHSSILAWEIPWTEEPSPWSRKRFGHDLATKQQQDIALSSKIISENRVSDPPPSK